MLGPARRNLTAHTAMLPRLTSLFARYDTITFKHKLTHTPSHTNLGHIHTLTLTLTHSHSPSHTYLTGVGEI